MDDEKVDFEVVDSGGKRDGRGRRLEREEEKERLLELYERSGLMQKAFAEREGINYHTFVAWLCRRRRGPKHGGSPAHMDFAEFRLEAPVRSCGSLEVCLSDGTIVRGGDAGELAALVKALRS